MIYEVYRGRILHLISASRKQKEDKEGDSGAVKPRTALLQSPLFMLFCARLTATCQIVERFQRSANQNPK